MTFLAIVGAVVITGLFLWGTLGFVYLLFLQGVAGGWDILDKSDWAIIASISVVLIVCWASWWQFIGSHIHINVS